MYPVSSIKGIHLVTTNRYFERSDRCVSLLTIIRQWIAHNEKLAFGVSGSKWLGLYEARVNKSIDSVAPRSCTVATGFRGMCAGSPDATLPLMRISV